MAGGIAGVASADVLGSTVNGIQNELLRVHGIETAGIF